MGNTPPREGMKLRRNPVRTQTRSKSPCTRRESKCTECHVALPLNRAAEVLYRRTFPKDSLGRSPPSSCPRFQTPQGLGRFLAKGKKPEIGPTPKPNKTLSILSSAFRSQRKAEPCLPPPRILEALHGPLQSQHPVYRTRRPRLSPCKMRSTPLTFFSETQSVDKPGERLTLPKNSRHNVISNGHTSPTLGRSPLPKPYSTDILYKLTD